MRSVAPVLISGLVAALGVLSGPTTTGQAAAPPCNNYVSNLTPPENIGVAITSSSNHLVIVDVIYVDFKSYVKNVLPVEWLSGWESAAYQAGALAVKHFGWYWVNNWRGQSFNGECYHVTDWTSDQRYVAGSATPATDFAVEQTWNNILTLATGSIYPTFHNSGYSWHACGDESPPTGYPLGTVMSQYGSQACALAGWRWAQIVNQYYRPNSWYPGDHIYGEWHDATTWGPTPYWPLSVSGGSWKFRSTNSCGPVSAMFSYGNASDFKVIGNWDGAGSGFTSHTIGVVRKEGAVLRWYLSNNNSTAAYVWNYGQAGDIPIVGDWDGNGTWTQGIIRGAVWYLSNTIGSGGHSITPFAFGEGGDTPLTGRWAEVSNNMTPTVVRGNGLDMTWYQRYSNTSGETQNQYNYGDPRTDRPIGGDWSSAVPALFGPGVVRDWPPDPCMSPSATQSWHLKYLNITGIADVNLRYELNRP